MHAVTVQSQRRYDMIQKNALLSVFDKTGIVEFARALIETGYFIYASGGTAKALSDAGVSVVDVATIVGPPILGHRVVTLSREVHAGLLARDIPEDLAELARLNIPWFELVCIDLYPLEKEAARDGATMESIIEKTDIGGPTMIRSAAKGRRLVVTQPHQREEVLGRIRAGTDGSPIFRARLALVAEYHVAQYCRVSAQAIESRAPASAD